MLELSAYHLKAEWHNKHAQNLNDFLMTNHRVYVSEITS